MAQQPQLHQKPSDADTFIADRAMFWSRFTTFMKFGILAVVILLLGMWIFLT